MNSTDYEKDSLLFRGKVLESVKNINKALDKIVDCQDATKKYINKLNERIVALEVRVKYIWWLLALLISGLIGLIFRGIIW